MKLVTSTRFEPERVTTPAEAVTYFVDRAERHGEGEKARLRSAHDALLGVVGRTLDALIANGHLRADQVSEIFNYDVIAED